MAGRWELTDEQRALVEPVLRPARREDNRDRRWHDKRAVLNGMMRILGSGAQWSELPSKYPPYQTCHRRFQQWVREGKLAEALRLLAKYLRERRKLNLDEACHSRERQKGGFAIGPTRRGKGTKTVAIASGNCLPLAVTVESASPAECRLVEAVLAGCFLDELPEKLIGDKAYDSDALDQTLAKEYGIEMIAPNRGNRGKTQDGRPLRRYKTSLEGGTTVRLNAQLPPSGHSLGVSCRKLLWLRPTCLRPDAAQTFMRWLPVIDHGRVTSAIKIRKWVRTAVPIRARHIVGD
jgi:transposase